MQRIILHWTGGGHRANSTDVLHYHYIVESDGRVVEGRHRPSSNRVIRFPNDSSTYAAHTRGTNTGAIGVAVAAMRQAVERPFNPGPSPITEAQVDALVKLVAKLVRDYGLSVTRTTVLTHAEVEPTLGIRQNQKWDITWLPGMAAPGDPLRVGDELRRRVIAELQPAAPVVSPSLTTTSPRSTATILSFWQQFLSLFGK
jgi:N-acetyl-anhydromuramyl-L-alanine amidase AmpD